MKSNEVCRHLAGYQGDVVVEIGGLLYRVDSVVRLDGRFIVHTVDELEETREMLKAIAGKAKRRDGCEVFHDDRCSMCGAARLREEDGSAGTCSFTDCKDPMRDLSGVTR